MLTANKRSREYLLSLTPTILCQELLAASPETFHSIACGLLGSTASEIFEDKDKLNVVAMIIGVIARCNNRKASGYCHLLVSVARDGGLREDSM